jgi:hypothetical protein
MHRPPHDATGDRAPPWLERAIAPKDSMTHENTRRIHQIELRLGKPLCVLAGLLAAACGDSSDTTLLGPDEGGSTLPITAFAEGSAEASLGGGHDEFPPEPVLIFPELSIEGENLVLSLQNSTDAAATVSLSASINNPAALFFTESVGRANLAPHEFKRIVLPAGDIRGLNLADDEWTDATINFEYELADGRRGGEPVSIFAEYGQVALPRPVTLSGESDGIPFTPVPPDEVEKQAGTFFLCFQNAVTFSGVTQNDLDVFRSPVTGFPASGMFLSSIRHVATNTRPAAQYLNNNGCLSLPRLSGTWQFTVMLLGNAFPRAGNSLSAFRTDGAIPQVVVNKSVPSDFNTTASITMTAGEDRQLQTAFTAATMTINRASAVALALAPIGQLIIRMNASDTDYRHSERTLRVTPTSALSRRAVSHETGHWIHYMHARPNCTSAGINCGLAGADYNYCTIGDPACTPPAADDCTRSPDGTHGFRTVEWNGSAHIEGMANLFTALAFNNRAGGDCALVDNSSNRDCEAVGKTLETGETGNGPCFEWLSPRFFDTGVELDWTKMYWDFITDEGQSLLTYLTNEAGRTWTRRNHASEIFVGLPTTMRDALRRSAIGNIQEGAEH